MKKKFFTKLLLFLIIVGIIAGYLNNRYINTLSYKVQNAGYKFYNMPEKIQVGNVGSSHGQYAFVYEDTGLSGFNFGLPAQRLFYDHRFLEKYLDVFEEDSTLIIPLSYISFYLAYEGDNFETYNKVYYKYFPYNKMLKPNLEEYVKYGLLPILTADKGIEHIFLEEDTKIPEEFADYTMDIETMKAEAMDTGTRHLEFIEDEKYNTEQHFEELRNIIDLALENNIKPVIVTTPLTKYYTDIFSEEFKLEFNRLIEEFLVDYAEVPYIDYSHDERFHEKPELFFDSGHLNLEGGKLFTSIVIEDFKIK